MSSIDIGRGIKTPIYLLKTKSTPHDAYEEQFSAPKDGVQFEPIFVPVLEHTHLEEGMNFVRDVLHNKHIGLREGAKYGGMVFTSQRAVEAFAKLIAEGKGEEGWPYLQDVPIYAVGPATSRALKAILQNPPLNVLGETVNGEDLAHFMLDHYGELYKARSGKPPLLFLAGRQRRDIIPKTLMDPSLPSEQRIPVDERVVYETDVMRSFGQNFSEKLEEVGNRGTRWVVVFSPTGCDAMLRALFYLDPETHKYSPRIWDKDTTHIASIGTTTRDFLKNTFGFESDVCAAIPSPEGVDKGIMKFMSEQKG
ncbi:uncharacterized protein BP5553_08198 [Venustampulla echinocandica]|uniref:Tetrapyrrole biosynthesis uroporphyrinogen III synthase domain-containing protein n=1 Tax=Venustampulla echinocandica TaxID=2656787 RepID=A0A370TG11_9HELO|nr:uncharacterized protein BP5553_08198 [Venustampulla echinocandica]RDL33830.1 hypothetical protein BP5553_08198 [Venustampulla echinocandica]